MTINLISDTVTRPTPEMRAAMMEAPVGDDVFRQDPSINELEEKVAQLFGKTAALFCPSGTMTNQIALKIHTQRLDEVICDQTSHIYQYETGGYASNAGIGVNLLAGQYGKISAQQISAAIKEDYDWLPRTSLVVLENTCNKGGGSIYTLDEIKPIRQLCQQRNLKLHLDGARLFNALVETGETPAQVGEQFDSISLCLSKGLGAPVGSVLIGEEQDIRLARRIRKVMGGGMRQAGFLAAAGIYALDHHVDRLKEDNDHAKLLGTTLAKLNYVTSVRPVQSNVVIFDLPKSIAAQQLLDQLAQRDILATAFGPHTVRFVTHLEVSPTMISKVTEVLHKLQDHF